VSFSIVDRWSSGGPRILDGASAVWLDLLLAGAIFSFGNGRQAIEIARGCFVHFFQMRFEVVG
jgi:hypothetical protein